jgi:penicillin-binding protein 1A
MKGTLEYGTAAGNGIGCPAAGKTGTTEEQSDAWFVGFTPHVSTAVWTGHPDERVPLPGYGAQLSAPIWHDYMMVAADEPCDDFPEPENPAQLSSYYSEHTVDPNYQPYEPTDPADGRARDDVDSPDSQTPGDTNGYDPDLYAPGAGQDAAPAPGNGNGNQGNGNGNGGPASGGTGG